MFTLSKKIRSLCLKTYENIFPKEKDVELLDRIRFHPFLRGLPLFLKQKDDPMFLIYQSPKGLHL